MDDAVETDLVDALDPDVASGLVGLLAELPLTEPEAAAMRALFTRARTAMEDDETAGFAVQRPRANPWILFFDEADALFGKRTDVSDRSASSVWKAPAGTEAGLSPDR